MNLHYETVSPLLKETLQKLVNSPIFKDFTLIGGTCLSLQLGHRRSIDIDLFTDIDYGTMNTKEMKEFIQRSFPYSENTDSLDTSALGYTLYMGDSPIDKIKVDFFYTEKFIFPIQEIDHIRIADIREKAAMKIAFGENPKNCYKEKGVYSRMSVAAKLREVLQKTIIYDKKLREAGCETSWNEINRGSREEQVDISKMPAYDAKLEAMLPVIRGEIPLKAHAHRADDICTAIRIAKEFHLGLRLDHVTDGALIAKELGAEHFPVAVGPSFGHATNEK